MNKRLLCPSILLILGLALILPADRMTRIARTSSTGGQSGTSWVRYVMVGLGGFRGVISEILWIRADRLQQQGRYMELVQLSDWITALDPRATEGWTFNAWNLAYNIPAMLPDYQARLSWVQAGISLLQDKAIPANPDSARLYKELGWLYQDKIGSPNDSAHLVYKLDLASRYQENGALVRNAPPSPYGALDPALIGRIEKRFGKIDWRLADAHALYWACKGLELKPTGFDEDSLRRMVQQTLIGLLFAGHFSGNVETGEYRTEPDFELLPGLDAFFKETIRLHESEKKIYAIFLARLTRAYASRGQQEEAHAIYKKLVDIAKEAEIYLPSYQEIVSGTPIDLIRRP